MVNHSIYVAIMDLNLFQRFSAMVQANSIKVLYTLLGCPTQNSYIERFNGTYRRAVLDAFMFRNLEEVREITDKSIEYYNTMRPHDALGNMEPLQYREFLLHGS